MTSARPVARGVPRRGRRRRATVLASAVLLASSVAGCGRTDAQEVFADEPLAHGSVTGLTVLEETVVDGSSGGLLHKRAPASVVRSFATTGGADLDAAVTAVVETALAQGWTPATDVAQRPFHATKSLLAGDASLLVDADDSTPPARVVLRITLLG